MKNKKNKASLCGAITSVALAASFGFASDANAAVVIPLTGATVVNGLILSGQTTTSIGSGVGATASVPPGTYDRAFITFASTFTEASVNVGIGTFNSIWVRDGNTFTTTSQSQVDSVIAAISSTGPTGLSFTGSGGLPNGDTLQTLTFVPEPSSALLGAIGALMLLRRRR